MRSSGRRTIPQQSAAAVCCNDTGFLINEFGLEISNHDQPAMPCISFHTRHASGYIPFDITFEASALSPGLIILTPNVHLTAAMR